MNVDPVCSGSIALPIQSMSAPTIADWSNVSCSTLQKRRVDCTLPSGTNVKLCKFRFHVHDVCFGSIRILLRRRHDHRNIHVFRQSDDKEEECGGLQLELGNVGAAGWSVDVTPVFESVYG